MVGKGRRPCDCDWSRFGDVAVAVLERGPAGCARSVKPGIVGESGGLREELLWVWLWEAGMKGCAWAERRFQFVLGAAVVGRGKVDREMDDAVDWRIVEVRLSVSFSCS